MAWQFDPAHSSIEFSAKHIMITTVRGRFDKWSGTISLDEQHPESSSLEVTIEAASLDTNQLQRDEHLRSPDFLDVEKYPIVTFKSTRVEQIRNTTGKLYGNLTMRDVCKEVTLNVMLEGETRNRRGERVIGFSATTSLNRKDWGLSWNVALEAGGWLVSDRVDINIQVEVIQREQTIGQPSY